MICRNCNYILSGTEQFCPHCGASSPAVRKDTAENNEVFSPPIYTYEKTWDDQQIKQPPEKNIPEIQEQMSEETGGKGKKIAVIVSLSVLLVLLCTGGLYMVQSMDITPVLSAIISSEKETEAIETSALVTTDSAQLEKSFGTVIPELMYEPSNCYVTGISYLPVKKGPGDVYGQIALIKGGQQLQIIGGSVEERQWVYVYVPSEDCYGWMKGAYLTLSEALDIANADGAYIKESDTTEEVSESITDETSVTNQQQVTA